MQHAAVTHIQHGRLIAAAPHCTLQQCSLRLRWTSHAAKAIANHVLLRPPGAIKSIPPCRCFFASCLRRKNSPACLVRLCSGRLLRRLLHVLLLRWAVAAVAPPLMQGAAPCLTAPPAGDQLQQTAPSRQSACWVLPCASATPPAPASTTAAADHTSSSRCLSCGACLLCPPPLRLHLQQQTMTSKAAAAAAANNTAEAVRQAVSLAAARARRRPCLLSSSMTLLLLLLRGRC